MNLIDIYIHEVTRRIPEKSREDIALELRSTIADMLPEDCSEEEVKAVLAKLGNPVTLASNYSDRPMHLIGPRYFDVYITLLKLIVPIAAIIAVVSTVAQFFIGFGGEEAVINVVLDILGFAIWKIIEVTIQVFFWLTLVFAVLERTDKVKDSRPLTSSLKQWTPDDLKNIPYIPKKRAIPKSEVYGSLFWTTIWASLYFYADHLIGIYHGGGGNLEFKIPALNQDVLLQYWPIVIVVIMFDVAFALYKLIKGQWLKKMAVINIVHEVVGTGVFVIILLNPNLINPEFIEYMSSIFAIKHVDSWYVGGIITVFIAFSIYNIYDGFRKSKA